MEMGISINADDTINKAKEIYGLASNISGYRGKIDDERDYSQGFWTGSSGDLYREKLYKIDSKIESRATQLKKIADGLESSANRYKNVEAFAQKIFSR
jgi:WXG100 family type VII secretion target